MSLGTWVSNGFDLKILRPFYGAISFFNEDVCKSSASSSDMYSLGFSSS